jgi:hypothetical protein
MKKKFAVILTFMISSGCASVAPYQKVYLNDQDMALKSRKIESYDFNIASYREGASGGNGGKTGGGCGCN